MTLGRVVLDDHRAEEVLPILGRQDVGQDGRVWWSWRPIEPTFRTDPHDEGITACWYEPSLDEAGWTSIRTTRPFYRQGFDDSQGHQYLGPTWYRIKVDVPASAVGKRVKLCVPVVVTEAWCWINGRYVGHRPYQEAYTRPAAMEIDVTDAIRPGQPNVIALRVDTSLAAAQAAEGLQSRLYLYAPK